jgi:type II secretory pathway pseudopilin PulG
MMRSERAFTLIELVVGMFAMIVILTAILGLVKVSTANQDRVAERVGANQRIRPVMTRLMDELHSACYAPNVTPVLAGSSGSQMILISETGSAVSPTPDKHVITLTGSVLSEAVYPTSGGQLPNFTYSATPSSNRTLLTGVSAGAIGSPAVAVPMFRYYAYSGSTLSTTPLPTPLSAADAVRTAHVSLAFAAAPADNVTGTEQQAAITIADSANLLLEAPNENTTVLNLPCT